MVENGDFQFDTDYFMQRVIVMVTCCIYVCSSFLHSLYDIVAGFGDFASRQTTTEMIANNNTPSAGAYLANLCLFLPLLLYAIFLLRKR